MPKTSAVVPGSLREVAVAAVLGIVLPLVASSCASSAPAGDDDGRSDDCAGGLAECAGVCANLASDSRHCGQCGASCQIGQECRAGTCQCVAPLTSCGAACVDPRSDPAHCGGCNVVCRPGLFCSVSECSESCAPGLTPCGGACTDVTTSSLHCGACNAACDLGETCSGSLCAGSGAGGSGGSGGAGTGGGAGSGGSGGATGTGAGFLVGGTCFPACASDATDPDPDSGATDGYGYENGRSCIVRGSAPSAGAASCEPPPPEMPDAGIPPGDGFYIGGMCHPRCASDATDPDDMGVRDGWGYEMGRSCIVVDSAPSMGVPTCVPPGVATGDGYLVDMSCVPACTHPEFVEDPQGYGYEAQQTCVVTGSTAAMQNARCMLTPRTDLPPPGSGFQNGETCFPPCGANAQDVTEDGYGWDQNRTCIVPDSKASVQGVPCAPPPNTVTGECPRTLSCPVVGNVTLACGCTWVEGLGARKQVIMGTAGASQYFLASAMMETVTLTSDYPYGDNKADDAFNAGLAKQNWGMTRRCHSAWSSQTPAQYATSAAMNDDLALDIQVYNECRTMFGNDWWSGHRAGYNNLGMSTQDIQEFKGAMDWTNQMLTDHLSDDVRFWVTVMPI